MSTTYPIPAPVTPVSNADLQKLLASPTVVNRVTNEFADRTFLIDLLFRGRELTNGAALYEVNNGTDTAYLSQDPAIVAPGGEYAQAAIRKTAAAVAAVHKVGLGSLITDEQIGRKGRAYVDRQIKGLISDLRRRLDTQAMTTLGAAITETSAASSVWSAAGSNPWLDIMTAAAKVNEKDLGYTLDTCVVQWSLFPALGEILRNSLSGEARNNLVVTGQYIQTAGMTIVPAPSGRMAPNVEAFIVDAENFGFQAYEDIPSPEFTGNPATEVQTAIERAKGIDAWNLRGRTPRVAVVDHPQAGVIITGASQ